MADRRMFTKKVTDDDNFMSLSSSAQALYLHLTMSSDDDGFCNQVSLSMFKAHASVQDLQALLEKRYIYQFENGVIVIKHWRMANALRKDRYTPTAFQEELAKLHLKDNGSYTWLPDGCQVVADCLPQNSIGKNSIDKDSIGKNNTASETQGWNETKHTNVENANHLLEEEYEHKDFFFDNQDLWDAVIRWLSYKDKRKPKSANHYASLDSLLNKIYKLSNEKGIQNMIQVIDDSIASNYQGIVWNWLDNKKPQKQQSDVVNMWQKAFEESEARNNDQG